MHSPSEKVYRQGLVEVTITTLKPPKLVTNKKVNRDARKTINVSISLLKRNMLYYFRDQYTYVVSLASRCLLFISCLSPSAGKSI